MVLSRQITLVFLVTTFLLLVTFPSCLSFTSSLPFRQSSRASTFAFKSTPTPTPPTEDATNDPSDSSIATSSDTPSSTTNNNSQQSQYGTTLEMPNTYVRCGSCDTMFALTESDLGHKGGRGRRLECPVCSHSWFQSKERLLTLRDGFQLVPQPQSDKDRITTNMLEGKQPKFTGDVKLYVGNIAFECHEDDIYEIFSRCGSVGEVSLVRDDEGRNRGFGFVTMRTKEDGDRAKELDGSPVRGRRIAVRESNN